MLLIELPQHLLPPRDLKLSRRCSFCLFLYQESDIDQLEEKIGRGQAEELIVQVKRMLSSLHQAQEELHLAKRLLEWKVWEPLEEQPPRDQWKWPIN